MAKDVKFSCTTPELKAALAKKFKAPEHSLLWEVGDATGAAQRRWADAVIMSLWPSRGLELWGVELKVSRSDWKRELENPAKAEKIAAFCDRWWVMAPDGVVPVDEVPKAWGLMTWNGQRWATAKPAEITEAQPLNRDFLAALLRRAGEADAAMVAAVVEQHNRDREARFQERIENELRNRTRAHEELRRQVETFEQASGVQIKDNWSCNAKELGAAVKAVLASGIVSSYHGTLHMAEEHERCARRIREALDAAGFKPPAQIDIEQFTGTGKRKIA